MADLTLEQQRAIALAQARRRRQGGGRALAPYAAQRGASGVVGGTSSLVGQFSMMPFGPGGPIPINPVSVNPAVSGAMLRANTMLADRFLRGRAETAGLPTREELAPQSTAERYAGGAAEFAGATIPYLPFGGTPSLGRAAMETTIGAGQGLIYEGAKQASGENELVGAAASMVAPFAPGAGAAGLRSALGGGSRRMGPALADAAAIPGYRPSASEAGGSDIAAVAERAGSFTLGSRGTVGRRTEETNEALAREAERIATQADRLGGLTASSTRRGAEAGNAIYRGLREDADSWFNRSKAAAEGAESAAGREVAAAAAAGQNAYVDVTPILARLRAGAVRQNEWGKIDPHVNDLAERLTARAGQNGGLLPLEQAIRLKTQIGDLTRWSGAAPGADVALYRGLYGQLAEQITKGVARLSPQAVRAWKKSQTLWHGHFERVRNYLDPVEAKIATPEHIANSVLAIGTPSRATALRRMVGERRWNQVRAYAIRRLGSSQPSGIDGTLAPGADDVFNPMTFATNWNAMQRSGHLETIFGGRADRAWAQLRPELDRLARVAGRIQRTRRAMFNSSASATSGLPAAQVTTLGGAVAAAPFVGPAPLIAVLGGMGAVGITSRLMMSPRFVRWLASNGAIPVNHLAVALARLATVIQSEKDPEARAEMQRLHDQLAQGAQQ
jgi:hypothetical protein